MDQPNHRIKRAKSKATRDARDISRVEIRKFEVPAPMIPKKYEIHRSDVADLHFLGVFHSKAIVTYCSRMDCFVYFDQHAIHERIRYEFYV